MPEKMIVMISYLSSVCMLPQCMQLELWSLMSVEVQIVDNSIYVVMYVLGGSEICGVIQACFVLSEGFKA